MAIYLHSSNKCSSWSFLWSWCPQY